MPNNNNNNNNNEINRILNYFEDSKKNVTDLQKELKELKENIWSHQTSLERIKELQEEINESTREYNKYLNEGNNREIIKIYEKINKLINEGKKDTQEYVDLKEELLKYGKDEIEAGEIFKNANKLKEISLRNQIKLQKELNHRQEEGVTFLDDWKEKYERNTKVFRKGIKEIADGAKGVYSSITNTLKPWAKANDEAMKYARTMGMSQKTADKFLSNTVSWASKNNIGILFNKSTEELIKMQSKYSEVLGRNVQLTSEQKKDMLAMEAFLGEDGMADIANNLENFGMGMSDSADFVKKQLDTATKSGIVASKLTKTIRENIKMAQNYTFKNGLDGLASMAKKAVELKTDMSLVDGFANNVSTVEGAITTGAKLQVLGGSYAMGSDPLSMMYESLNDMEGLFDRAVGMAKGKVFYNNETGNFEMGAMDRYMMKQAATAMGVDPNKMLDVAFRQASLDKIKDQISLNSNISGDEEMVDMVKNLATWDNGQAVVNIDGKDKLVSELGKKDKEKLEAMQRTDSQNLQEMAINLRSMNDIMSGTEKEINNEQANIMKGIGESINNWLKDSTGLLNGISNIFAWGKTLGGISTMVGGILHTTNGILHTIKGTGLMFDDFFDGDGGPDIDVDRNGKKKKGKGKGKGKKTTLNNKARGKANVRGVGRGKVGRISRLGNMGRNMFGGNTGISLGQVKNVFHGGLREKTYQYNGKTYKTASDGTLRHNGRFVSNNEMQNVLKNGTKVKSGWTNLAKAAGKGMKVGGAMAAVGGAISIGTDIATGEFQKDMGRSIGKAAGPMVGSIIGGIFGPVGAMVGGFLGGLMTEAIQGEQDRVRKKVRSDIASKNAALNPILAKMFEGDNAIQANLSKNQLKSLEKAISDGTLTEDEISGSALRKLRNNGDLYRLKDAGIGVKVAFADGGLLNGKPHSQGGMPILGSNMEVEGGEFVVNKKATSENLPLLETINNGDYKVTPIEPLGKQLKVNNTQSPTTSSNVGNSKIEIKPISINLSGTIKLESGNKQVDISNELLNNPQLISKLTEMINKQINILDNGSYVKNTFKQKFT